MSFLVVDPRGRVVATPRARVWIARSRNAKPFAQTDARLEPIGIPGVSTGADAKSIYVAHVRIPAAGHYYAVARPLGGSERIGALGDVIVADQLYSYGDGKQVVADGKGGEFFHALRTFDLKAAWKMDAAFLAREFDMTALSRERPPSKQAERRWLLRAIDTHQSGGGYIPAEHPDRRESP